MLDRLAPALGEQRECGFDDRLCLGARVEHLLRHDERQTPELAPADDF